MRTPRKWQVTVPAVLVSATALAQLAPARGAPDGENALAGLPVLTLPSSVGQDYPVLTLPSSVGQDYWAPLI